MRKMFLYNKKGMRTLLRKAFFDSEGNLKAASLGIVAVLVLVSTITVVFQVKKPAEKAVLRIVHLFNANPRTAQKDTRPEKPDPGEEEQPTKPEEKEETKQVQKDTLNAASEIKAIKEETRQIKEASSRTKEEAQKTILEAKKIQEEAMQMKAGTTKNLAQKDEKIKKLTDELARHEESIKEAETKNAEQQRKLEEKEEKLREAEEELKIAEEQKDAPQQSKEAKTKALFTLEKNTVAQKETHKPGKNADGDKKQAKNPSNRLTSIVEASKWSGAKKRMDSLKLPADSYAKLYRARLASGAKVPATQYRWRVSNHSGLKLRDCYNLFDMKAVAVTRNGHFYDLSDLTRLTEEYLNKNYSSTVILCENPEDDFGGQIEKLGIRTSELIVRYYMYDHTSNYFYNRVEKAISCCQVQGNIPSGKDAKDLIDVVGSVYKVKKDGGAFGIFVPTAVYLQNSAGPADKFSVSCSCFENEEDVKMLRANNLI